MKSLFIHARDFETDFHSFANRPKNIVNEELNDKAKQSCSDCVVVLITVEKNDCEEVVDRIIDEIIKICNEFKRKKVVITPFAHLSNNLAEPALSLEIFKSIETKLIDVLDVLSVHFGSNKSLLLKTYGHVGNIRFREF